MSVWLLHTIPVICPILSALVFCVVTYKSLTIVPIRACLCHYKIFTLHFFFTDTYYNCDWIKYKVCLKMISTMMTNIVIIFVVCYYLFCE